MNKVKVCLMLVITCMTIYVASNTAVSDHHVTAQSSIPTPCAPPPPKRFTYALIGDFGICERLDGDGGGFVDHPHWRCARQRIVRDLINSFQASKLFTVGDNTYEWARDPGFTVDDQNFYSNYYQPHQLLPVLGNHDWDDDTPTPPSRDGDDIYLSSQHFQYLGNYVHSFIGRPDNQSLGRYYQLIDGSAVVPTISGNKPLIHFFALSADPEEPHGRAPGSIQEQWMRPEMLGSDACLNVVYFHQPAYTSGAEHLPEDPMRWDYHDLRIDIVFMGHAHQYEYLVLNLVQYFVNGFGGAVNLHGFKNPPADGSVFRYPTTTAPPYNDDRGAQKLIVSYDYSTGVGRISSSMYVVDTASATGPTPVPNPRMIHAAARSKQCGLRWTVLPEKE